MTKTSFDLRQLKDIPALRQLAVLFGIAGAVALGIWAFSWSQQPPFVPVYGQLSNKDAAELAEALRAAGMPFRVDTASGAISVPEAQVHDARLKLASQGLPRGAGQGFELIQQEQGFGTSQFIETARYQHALETELARTIGNLQPVRGARLHLAIPKPSAFTRNREAPSASVFVELHPGRTLEQNQVASIVHMVASSVSGLSPSDVTVVDQSGRLLSNSGNDNGLAQSAEQLDYRRRVEADYVRRVEQLLTPLVGSGRVSAQVAAELDFSVTEEARESYTPDPSKIRSEQIVEDTTRGAATPAGIPGATSNQPPKDSANPPLNALAGGSSADGVQTQSKQAMRNYELDRTVSHTRQAAGQIKRLSVAVLVDHVPRPKADGKKNEMELVALSAEELKKVESLVREAVGFNETRGDSVAVQNAPFVQTEIPLLDDVPLWQQPQAQSYVRQALGLGVVLLLVLMVVRPALKTLMSPAAVPAFTAVVSDETRALPDDRVSLPVSASALQQNNYDQKLQAARQAVVQDPKRVAQVVKTWVGQEA